MEIVPEDKMKNYLKWCKGKKVSMICDCGKTIKTEITPYFYDEKENDIYFASLCPHCGELLITKE